MLQHLVIRNYALVEALEMAFHSGMTTITGETGAGKSILLGALALALGDRADKSVVRIGAERADITASFALGAHPEVRHWLAERELTGPEPDECLLRRVVGVDGRSRGFINGTPVTLADLSALGDQLLDIHSQHEHQSLLKRATHQRLLDEFGVPPELRLRLRDTVTRWQQNQDRMAVLAGDDGSQDAQRQLLGYQLRELDELDLAQDELASLDAEFQRLQHAETTIETLTRVLAMCTESDESTLAQGLNQAIALLTELPHQPPALTAVAELLNNALIQVEEAGSELRRELDRVDIDPQRLAVVNARLGHIHQLARKHKIRPEALFDLHQTLRAQALAEADASVELERLRALDLQLRAEYSEVAQALTTARRAAAATLSDRINQQLKTLAMGDARFDIALVPNESNHPHSSGGQTVEFVISTNPGQPPKPLNRIASGGELSRISLAIQVITAATSKIPTLVFDEVDVGIGGGVAREVGSLLRTLGERTQVICVTHQAQVASQAHHHLRVSKQTQGKRTISSLTVLSAEEKIREIARMLSGDDTSEASLAHARELLI